MRTPHTSFQQGKRVFIKTKDGRVYRGKFFDRTAKHVVLHEVRKSTTPFNRCKWDYWTVKVIEVDQEKRRVFASWNGNAPKWIYERQATKYRAKNPND